MASSDPASLHQSISARAFMGETEAVSALLKGLTFLDPLESKIRSDAGKLIEPLRQEGLGHGLEAFLQEYGLGSKEGVALMCLAEALLRIPDAETADRLIHGTFDQKQWEKHLGNSDSLLVNASSWGLLLTGKIIRLSDHDGPAAVLAKLAGKIGEPVVREALKAAMRFIGAQFVLGEDVRDALTHSASFLDKGFRFSYDLLGEGARSDEQAQAYVRAYHEAITLIGKQAKGLPLFSAPGISVKLSALHPRYQLLKRKRVMNELLPRLKTIVLDAMKNNIAVSIDAEESTRLDIEILVFSELFADPALAGWNGLGFVLQAYQRRAFYLIDYLSELARTHGKKMPLRLVKGAYWDSEIKAAQIAGLPSYPVFTRKEHTDVSYLACAEHILHNIDCFFPQFATHNARTLSTIRAMASHHKVAKEDFEFQRLHGMGEALYDMMVREHPCRIYAPIGQHKDLLAYLIRRLLENGANTSFVHLLMDETISLDKLLENPVAVTKAYGGSHHESIPDPQHLYKDTRVNSGGMDFGNLAQLEALNQELSSLTQKQWPHSTDASPAQLFKAVSEASDAFANWSTTSVEDRSRMLEKVADTIEKRRVELMALLAREAGRTLGDALNEVREAADFCRYYARIARDIMQPQLLTGPTGESNQLSLHARGVIGCISPWNFPLSIFTGQIAAALATGNCVIAKPAEQTPDIATLAVTIMHEAGVPQNVLHLVPGKGETIGKSMVDDPRISGIAFTGSMEVAQIINRSLASRGGAIAPLVAETGGLNCMVVDSSALLEQAVDDIVASAFGSAGQRCSSLRVLYVQQDIADALLVLLKGAMQELALGDPLDLSTDIGPVIDEEAKRQLLEHIERMKQSGRLVATSNLPVGGRFVAPHAFEITSIRELKREVFGPILHIIRFAADDLQRVADDINSSGYGLTFGMQSRIDENIEFFLTRVRAGNMYVNRSMIGAVVGVQPFGGEGLSGTGPKAGGPHYLLRFVTERAVTVNTAAIGGNVTLLSGSQISPK